MFNTPSTPSPPPPESPIPQYTTNLLNTDTPTTLHPRHLTLGSINVQGGLTNGFFHSLCEQAALNSLDIVGVQETNASPQRTKSLLYNDNSNILNYKAIWASSTTQYKGSGVGLLIHKKWHKYKLEAIDDSQGRGLAVRFGFKAAAHFAIITCYLPQRYKHPTIFATTEQWLRGQIDHFTQQGCHVLLLGDFNGVVNPSIDRANKDRNTTMPELPLFNWLTNNSFIDTYRAIHPTDRLYTWNQESRIDMIWSDPTLASYLHSVSSFPLLTPISSDHLFIVATFSVRSLIRPSPAATRGTYDKRSKKISLEDATDENWEAFASRVDDVLCRHGDLQALNIPTKPSSQPGVGPDPASTPEPHWDAIQTLDLATVPLEQLWHVLEDAIMSAAKYTLPCKRVGGPPSRPHGSNRLRARTADIGRAIRRVEDDLLDPDASPESRATIHSELMNWTTINTNDLNLPNLPSLEADFEQWRQWLDNARQQWRVCRSCHTAFTTGKNQTNSILTAIDRRNLRFQAKPQATIKNILEVQSSRVHLDHIIATDAHGNEWVIDEPEEVKRATLEYFRDVWHAPRTVQDPDEKWARYYAPRTDIDPTWFETLMDTPSREETDAAITAAPNNKAPGESGLSGDMLKRLGPLARSLFHLVLQACVVQAAVPTPWLRGMLYCIPKGPCWTGRLADVRPLTLLEHGRKILFSILVNRFCSILSSRKILSGVNFSVLPGTTTKDPIHILNAVMEDAREHNQEAWILFQDIRRCFDSVSCRPGQTLERSLTRLRVHPRFTHLCTSIAEHKTNVVITAFGMTEPYRPGCGLDQGGVECPLFWLICYDVLLKAVIDSGMGYVFMRRNSLVEQRRLPPMFETEEEDMLTVPASAFVDDTNWYAPSKENMEVIVELALDFFQLNAIEINPKKTELITINPSHEDTSITVGGTVVQSHSPTAAVRSLGVWFTADGRPRTTATLVVNEVQATCSILARRAITDKQAIVIVNNVLIPRVLYRMAVTVLPASTIKSIVARYTSVVRQKFGLPAGTPNSILFHRRLYGLRHLGDVQDEEQISTALLRFQDQGLVGQVMATRALSLQAAAGLVSHPCSTPERVNHNKKGHFLAQVCGLMVARQICFNMTSNIERLPSPPLSEMIPAKAYSRIGPMLFRDGVVFLQDVVSEHDGTLLPWAALKERHELQGPVRSWYAALVYHLTSALQSIDNSTDSEDSIGPVDIYEADSHSVPTPTRVINPSLSPMPSEAPRESTPLIDPRIRRRAEALTKAAQTLVTVTSPEDQGRVRIKKNEVQKAAASKDGALTPTHSPEKDKGLEPDKTKTHDLPVPLTPIITDSQSGYRGSGAFLTASNEVSDGVLKGSSTLKARSPLLTESSSDKVIKEEVCEEEHILFIEMGSEEDEPGMWEHNENKPQSELRDSAPPPVVRDKGKRVVRESGMVLGDPFYEGRVTSLARVDFHQQEESSEEDSDGFRGTRVLLGRKERQQRKKEKNVTLQKEKRQGITTRGSKRPNHNSTTKEKEVINTNTTTKKTNAKEKEKEKSIAQHKEANKRPGRTPTPPLVPSVSSLSLTFLSSLNSFPFSSTETSDPPLLPSTALIPETPFPSDSDSSDSSFRSSLHSPSPPPPSPSPLSTPLSTLPPGRYSLRSSLPEQPPSTLSTPSISQTSTQQTLEAATPSTFSSRLGPEADILLRQDVHWLDQIVERRAAKVDSDAARKTATLIERLKARIITYQQQYGKDVQHYQKSLHKDPLKRERVLRARQELAGKEIRALQVDAQNTLNSINKSRQLHKQRLYTQAETKNQQHQDAARDRLQALSQYIQQTDEDNLQMLTRNKVRMQHHLPPLLQTIDVQARHTITTEIPAPAPDPHIGLEMIGPVWMPPEQAVLIRQQQQTPITIEPRILYSDGSLINHGSKDCAMAFAVVDLQSEDEVLVSGRVNGHASSTKAELMGVFAAILSVPAGQDLVVRSDNQTVVDNFKDLVMNRDRTLPRRRARATHSQHWAVLANMVADRTGSTAVEWIRGHSGDLGNEKADRAAKVAVLLNTMAWKVELRAQDDIPFSASFQGATMEQDLRELLKAQTTIRNHQSWSAQKRVQRALGDLSDIEWRSTLSTIHNKRPVFTYFSGRKDTTHRTQHIKKMHGMMPTLSVMAARHPELYGNGLCCMCRQASEDNSHLWRCPNSMTAQKIAWNEAIDKINDWGQEAVAKANREAQKRHENRQQREPLAAAPEPQRWCAIAAPRVWESLAVVFDGLETLSPLDIDIGLTTPPDGRRSWADVYLGLLPLKLVHGWKSLFNSTTTVAASVAHCFVKYLDTIALSRLWKTRCEATIAWEKVQNITRKQKWSPSDRGSGDWHDGTGFLCPAGFCRCGKAEAEHTGGVCPGPQDDTSLADQRLFNSIHGLYNLVLLEKRGKIPFY